jgi:hypothetical protein
MYGCLTINNLAGLLRINGLLVLFDHVYPFDNRSITVSIDSQDLANPPLILTGDDFNLIIFP